MSENRPSRIATVETSHQVLLSPRRLVFSAALVCAVQIVGKKSRFVELFWDGYIYI